MTKKLNEPEQIHQSNNYRKAGCIRYEGSKNKRPHYLAYAIALIFLTPVICIFGLMICLGKCVILIFLILSFFILSFIYKSIEAKNPKIALLSVTAGPLLLIAGGYHFWHSGSPLGVRVYAPSGEFYYQRYQTIGPSFFSAGMPGQGSDSIDGFIRLYDSNGNLLNEYFTTYLLGVEPHWLDDSLWLMGITYNGEEIIWYLPEQGVK